MKSRRVLLIILGVVVLAGIGVGIWAFVTHRTTSDNEIPELRNINVQALASDDEKKLGTIIYNGAKANGDVTTNDTKQIALLTTTDSLDGASNIYYQDLLNRYKSYGVTRKNITKDDALDKKAVEIVCTGQTGTITITLWGDTSGMTQIEIVTTKDFK